MGGATSQFLYDGVKMIAEFDGGGNLLRQYVDGPATDDPLVWYEGAGTGDPRYYTIDEQGSVIGLTNAGGTTHVNPSGGAMILAYDEYGYPATYNLGRYAYTGQVWLPEVGLYYYKARVYSPVLGRFLQTDPIGYKDGMNWYAYVGDDPTDEEDPTGDVAVADDAAEALIAAGAVLLIAYDLHKAGECEQASGCVSAAARQVGDFIGGLIHHSDQEKGPPSPNGSRGSQEHQDKIKGRIEELKGEGKKHVAGGDKPEETVQTPGGTKETRNYGDSTLNRSQGPLRVKPKPRHSSDPRAVWPDVRCARA